MIIETMYLTQIAPLELIIDDKTPTAVEPDWMTQYS